MVLNKYTWTTNTRDISRRKPFQDQTNMTSMPPGKKAKSGKKENTEAAVKAKVGRAKSSKNSKHHTSLNDQSEQKDNSLLKRKKRNSPKENNVKKKSKIKTRSLDTSLNESAKKVQSTLRREKCRNIDGENKNTINKNVLVKVNASDLPDTSKINEKLKSTSSPESQKNVNNTNERKRKLEIKKLTTNNEPRLIVKVGRIKTTNTQMKADLPSISKTNEKRTTTVDAGESRTSKTESLVVKITKIPESQRSVNNTNTRKRKLEVEKLKANDEQKKVRKVKTTNKQKKADLPSISKTNEKRATTVNEGESETYKTKNNAGKMTKMSESMSTPKKTLKANEQKLQLIVNVNKLQEKVQKVNKTESKATNEQTKDNLPSTSKVDVENKQLKPPSAITVNVDKSEEAKTEIPKCKTKEINRKLKQTTRAPTQKTVQFKDKPSPFKNFRKRILKNYAESSLNESDANAQKPAIVQDKSVPIYKRNVVNDEEEKNKSNEYEFDSDSEQKKTHKPKRLRKHSVVYDRTIEEILKKVMKKIEKKKNPVKSRKEKKPEKKQLFDGKNVGKAIMPNVSSPPKKLQNNMTNGADDDFDNDPEPFEVDDEEENIPNYSVENNFGFTDLSPPPNKNPRVNIVQNLILRSSRVESLDSPITFNRRPTANSTMLNERSPWRLNVNYKRNPHFIEIKKSCLPAISQDIVLDHTIVETEEKSQNPEPQSKKSPVQTSILNYVQSTAPEIENTQLFDYGDLSPIKERNNPVVKTILKERSLNVINSFSTPVREQNRNKAYPDISAIEHQDEEKENENTDNFFGFASDVEEECANTNADVKPTRFDASALKRYCRKPVRKKVVEFVEPEVVEENEELDEGDNYSVHLFEEIKDPNEKQLLSKKRKRLHVSTTEEDMEVDGRIRKKRDPRTKAEIEATERWIEQFNATCREIEKFELEVE